MGAVDIADQHRAGNELPFRWRRGPTPPLVWGFLLGVMMTNAFLLDSKYGAKKDNRRNQMEWRKELVLQLFSTFSPYRNFRKIARFGYFADKRNNLVPISDHQRGKRGDKRASCKVCRTFAVKARRAKKEALRAANLAGDEARIQACIAALEKVDPDPEEGNGQNGKPKSKGTCKKKQGCLTCDVALCVSGLCWDIFHACALGII